MPNIRYVCLSDLHLGEEDSLLTNVKPGGEIDTTSPSPVLVQLVECISELLRHNDPKAPRPTLVLNGDIIELALCPVSHAVMVFTQLISLLMNENNELFGEIIYLPGNHDHHVWETARETQYLSYIQSQPVGSPLEPPWSTTKVFMNMQGEDRLVHPLLTGAAQRLAHLRKSQCEILTAYPNFGVFDTSQSGRSVVFHHGHFIEAIYHMMSTVTSLIFSHEELPDNVYALEEENSVWIDFFWSAMGSSGRVGQEIECLYEATNDRNSLRRLMDSLSGNLAKRYDIPYLWPDWTEVAVLRWLFRGLVVNRLAGRQERQQTTHDNGQLPLTDGASKGLRWYLEKLLRRQMEQEHDRMPDLVTFVFGHTHKAFQQVMGLEGYRSDVKVLNTGGWTVESVEPQPLHGGSVVLIDEGLDAVSLHMYHEGEYVVRVEEPRRPEDEPGELYGHVNRIMKNNPQPWRKFAEVVAPEVLKRAEDLRKRISQTGLARG